MIENNVDSNDEVFGPASKDVVRDWVQGHDIIEIFGIFGNHEDAEEASERYLMEMRARYMPRGYSKVACSMVFSAVNSILEEEEERNGMPSPEEVKAHLTKLLNDGGIQEIEDEDECDIHYFIKDDDDEPTLN